MIKIFLVEDEHIALQGLKFKVESLGDPYEVIGTAVNGIDALEKLKYLKPDILITDISMPGMDGLQLIERLYKELPEILTIILTGYQEFDYAKQAIRFGVKDYLLKPLDIDELHKCLMNCQIKLEETRAENIISLLIGDNSYSYSTSNGTDEFAVAYLIASNFMSTQNSLIHPEVPYISTNSLEELLSGRFPDKLSVRCFDGIFTNEKALVISGPHVNEKRILQILNNAAPQLNQIFRTFVTVYFSCVPNQSLLNPTILLCRTEAIQSIILGRTQICSRPSSKQSIWIDLQNKAKLFLLLINQNKLATLHTYIRELFKEWDRADRTAMSVQNDLQFLLEYFQHNASLKTTLSTTFLIENLMCFYQDTETFADNFYQLLVHLCNSDSPTDFRSVTELVDKIDIYLQENLFNPLSLQILADEFKVSKVYLCRVFKKHKNMTPIDYFNRLKIAHAQKLLVEIPAMPQHEIATLLGFNDVYYFSKVFKRITGKTPSEIRGTRTDS